MTNGTDTTKFKLSGTDKVDDIGKESRVAPKLLTVSEKGLIIIIKNRKGSGHSNG